MRRHNMYHIVTANQITTVTSNIKRHKASFLLTVSLVNVKKQIFPTQGFSCETCEIFKNTILMNINERLVLKKMLNILLICSRSSHRSCSVRKGVVRNFAKFTGKHLCQSLFFNKISFIKKGTLTQVCFCEFCEISKNTLFTDHLRVTTSEDSPTKYSPTSSPAMEKPYRKVIRNIKLQGTVSLDYQNTSSGSVKIKDVSFREINTIIL